MKRQQNEKLIYPNDNHLNYMGRIDFSNPGSPTFIYPYSMVKFRFKGTSIKVVIKNNQTYWDNFLGVVVDGQQSKFELSKDNQTEIIEIASGLADTEHNIILFKRQDSCHYFDFCGLILTKEAELVESPNTLTRKIEFYGDSVTAGEVSEAVDYVGQPDPEHTGEYSNSWYSYASITARHLNAEVNLVAQGGIALMDGTGYFVPPGYLGMEKVYDKLRYNPQLGEVTPWDFNQFLPSVVVVAIGQNDNHPNDFMKEDYNCELARHWRARYKQFIETLRAKYPAALIVLQTTILMHHENWDNSIEEVCQSLHDKKIVHFMYSLNGTGTPGHIRISEAELMARELTIFIESFGEDIWMEL